jgi:hypothetical protein
MKCSPQFLELMPRQEIHLRVNMDDTCILFEKLDRPKHGFSRFELRNIFPPGPTLFLPPTALSFKIK